MPSSLIHTILWVAIFYTLWLPLVEPPKGTASHKTPYYTIAPPVLLSFLVLLYEVGYYFAGPSLRTENNILEAFLVFLFCSILSVYYIAIIPNIFSISFTDRTFTFIKTPTPIKAIIFILPFPVVMGGVLGFFGLVLFEAFWATPDLVQSPRSNFERDPSLAWIGILVYFAILWILNRVWLRPYLLRTKGRVSRDDQLPYFIIPTLIVVLSVFLFDAYRYSLEAIQIEQLRFSFTLFFFSAETLVFLGFILPRVYYFRFQEMTFARQPSRTILSNCIMGSTILIGVVFLGIYHALD